MRRTPSHIPTQSSADDERGGDSYIRRSGREFIIALYAVLRALKLYPLENAAVQNALEDLTALAADLIEHERELELRVSGEFIFINATRLRLDLDNYASFSHILSHVPRRAASECAASRARRARASGTCS